jgi:hypothetical protein
MVFRVRPGHDDLVGRRIKDEIFHGEERMPWNGDIEDMAMRIEELAGQDLLSIEPF